ncbi:histone-lysine N-methyltransferase SETD2-like [Cuculus canorus]|uniref:histone-lysine N-methyltransferase SETD2-like n=1 Tax=Cuculus canorus TaxID=55661 RepID=UPI0023AA52BE|nr:histone-lysine N-methyltransferase SETD2-like [Cuculus canorus]
MWCLGTWFRDGLDDPKKGPVQPKWFYDCCQPSYHQLNAAISRANKPLQQPPAPRHQHQGLLGLGLPARLGSVRQGNSQWGARSAGRPSAANYQPIQGQILDSLTDDYKDYEEDDRWDDDGQLRFPSPSSECQAPRQKAEGSVQARKMSGSSCKEPVPGREKKVVTVVEKNNAKKRGPPKRRHPELESNSEGDVDSRDKKVAKLEAGQVEAMWPNSSTVSPLCIMDDFKDPQRWKEFAKQGKMPPYFDLIEENVYLTERKNKKSHQDVKHVVCQCPPLSKEQRAQGQVACGGRCLNRLLQIECSSQCPNGNYCSNRRLQEKQHADVEVILTEDKGWGLRAAKDLPPDTFIMEYCGEVLDHKEFKARRKEYARNKNVHSYFVAVKENEIIDATQKGNYSRFMNHSCEPNCEAQKWMVNGQLRVGLFTTKLVPSGSELTFDYQFQQYSKEAQKCFCGSANCRGYLGGEKGVIIRAARTIMEKVRSRKEHSVDRHLEALLENGEADSDESQGLRLSWLMLRIKTLEQKLTCLRIIQNIHSQSVLKSFLKHHGLSLLWIWMKRMDYGKSSTANKLQLQLEILKTLELLPIPTKNMLEDSKVIPIIERWAETNQSRKQTDKMLDVTNLATRLLNTWKQLKQVYRIPKKRPAEKESSANRGRDTISHRDGRPAAKHHILSRQQEPERHRGCGKRRRESSPLPSAYDRGMKRPVERYDTPASCEKRARIEPHHRLSLAERRKLFEQQFAQQEAQKQQQQNWQMAYTLACNSTGYGTPYSSFTGCTPDYPMQAPVVPSSLNAGEVLLPTPNMGFMGLPRGHEHLQTVGQRQSYGGWDCSQQNVTGQEHHLPAQSQPAWH